MAFTIGSFNVENLFGRARVLNLASHTDIGDKLTTIGRLQQELEKPVYDHAAIIKHYKQVKDYVSFNLMRKAPGVGRYLIYWSKKAKKYKVAAKGPDEWYGFVTFKRDKFDDRTAKNTARVIRDIKADVLCVIEAEDRPALDHFNSDRLNRRYPRSVLIDGNDPRGIDVGLYSKRPLGRIRTHIFEGTAKSPTFPRDCLEVEVLMEDGSSLFVLVNHFTSKSSSNSDSAGRRKRQATRVAEILEAHYDLAHDRVVVAGDFNDTPDSAALKPLLKVPGLHDVLASQFPKPADRWTYHYKKNEQIDFILVSKPLLDKLDEAGVERRSIARVDTYTNGAVKPYKEVTDWRNAASDHAAVWARFNV